MNNKHMKIIEWLLSQKSPETETYGFSSMAAWNDFFSMNTGQWSEPADRAVAGGFISDRPSYAFLAGFQSGLRSLIPSLPDTIVSFCISEENGSHPRNIKSTLERSNEDRGIWKLNGMKKFITCAPEARLLLIAASTGSADGKNILRLVRTDRDTPGIEIIRMKDLSILPEISHGILTFNNVTITDAQFLPGDAYEDYSKPFRTVEDIFVILGIMGYMYRIAVMFSLPGVLKEEILSVIVTVRALAVSDPRNPVTHIALAGLISQAERLFVSMSSYWSSVDEHVRKDWERDRALMYVAGDARKKRLEKAWSLYGG